jgi:hypothetical protein
MLTRAALLTAEMTGHSTLVITIEDNFGFKKKPERAKYTVKIPLNFVVSINFYGLQIYIKLVFPRSF